VRQWRSVRGYCGDDSTLKGVIDKLPACAVTIVKAVLMQLGFMYNEACRESACGLLYHRLIVVALVLPAVNVSASRSCRVGQVRSGMVGLTWGA
jgi:hypothetical protein